MNNLKTLDQKVQKEHQYLNRTFIGTAIIILGAGVFTKSIFYFIGVGLMLLAMFILVNQYRKNQSVLHGQDHDFSNQKFVRNNIQFLETRRNITARYMPVYAFFLILGINVAQIDHLKLMGLTPGMQLLVHLGFSLLFIILFYVGIKQHLKKLDASFNPVLEELKGIG